LIFQWKQRGISGFPIRRITREINKNIQNPEKQQIFSFPETEQFSVTILKKFMKSEISGICDSTASQE